MNTPSKETDLSPKGEYILLHVYSHFTYSNLLSLRRTNVAIVAYSDPSPPAQAPTAHPPVASALIITQPENQDGPTTMQAPTQGSGALPNNGLPS
ncbi:hypothetical protein FRB90_003842, partial [Tulasnella sp. 427]